MNLMDMLSGDAPDAMFQSNDADDMQTILDNAAPPSSVMHDDGDDHIDNGHSNGSVSNGTRVENGPIQTNDGVYHLPTVLTNVQRELSETVLQVLSPVLLSEAYAKRQRASINSLLDNSSDDNFMRNPNEQDESTNLAFYEKVNLLYDQLRIIKKHPSLLVEHFIPKKLLLSEINERLINLSGKLQLFNRIVDSFIDRFPRDCETGLSPSGLSNTGFHILVVADGIKELELIEGVIIGKNLHYRNLSGSKLYNDKKPMPNFSNHHETHDSDASIANRVNGTHQTDTSESSRTKKRWGSRSNASSERKRRRKHIQRSSGNNNSFLCLYLVTSSQLYNNYTPASNSKNSEFNLIISFDSNLDTKNPSIELIRSKKSVSSQPLSTSSFQQQQLKTPILIPLPLFTLDHIALEYPAPSNYGRSNFRFDERDPSSQLFQWKFQCLNVFAVNRFNNFDPLVLQDFYHKTYGSNMEKLYTWFHKWDSMRFPLDGVMSHYNDRLNLQFSDERLIKKLEYNYLFDTELLPHRQVKEDQFQKKNKMTWARLEKFGYADYKKKLAELLNERVAQIDDTVVEKFQKDLPAYRIKETLRQISLDTQEEAIAESYRKLRQLNDSAVISEKKLNRVDADYSKLEVVHSDYTEKLHFLQSTIRSDSATQLTEMVESQAQQLNDLKDELTSLETEYNKLNDENEDIRAKYQNSSSEAVQLSTRLASLKDENARLETKLNGPGIRIIPSLIKKDDLINHEVELSKLKKENEFINHFFNAKLDKLIKERNTVLDNTTSGSSSRPGNRISRGSTPF